MMTIQELAKKVKMDPARVRSRLRRKLNHSKGERWTIRKNQVEKVIRLLQE
jgi:hypothetical protein